jgi:hypothetical protein
VTSAYFMQLTFCEILITAFSKLLLKLVVVTNLTLICVQTGYKWLLCSNMTKNTGTIPVPEAECVEFQYMRWEKLIKLVNELICIYIIYIVYACKKLKALFLLLPFRCLSSHFSPLCFFS